MNQNLNSSLNREDSLECAICLQPCMRPVELPCSHVFCFLCAKGIAMQSRKCALCRSSIPQDLITNPSLYVKQQNCHQVLSDAEEKYVWYYQGNNGWWQYDERTCADIEAAYKNKAKSLDVLVAGSVYIIDLENHVQYQRHRNSRKRQIKRDFVTANKKGVAGLETNRKPSITTPQPSCSTDVSARSNASNRQSPAASTCTGNYNTQQMLATTSASGDEAGRQLPIGSDETITTVISPLDGTPALLRATTDPTSNDSSSETTASLFRSNTCGYPARPSDEPME